MNNLNNSDLEIIAKFKRKKVYFEKQSNDKLCGIHCLNSLVQAPLFGFENLTEIAKQLDDLEKKLLSEEQVIIKFIYPTRL